MPAFPLVGRTTVFLLMEYALSGACLGLVYDDGGSYALLPSIDEYIVVSGTTHVDILEGGWSGQPLSVRGRATVDIYGSTFLCAGFSDDAIVNIYGGTLWNGFSAEDRVKINIYDLSIPVVDQVSIFDDAIVTVYGQDFSWGYGSFSYPTVWGQILTGVLGGGGAFEWRVYTGTLGGPGMAPDRRDGGTLILAPIPEPISVLYLAVGISALIRRRKQS